MTNLQLSKLLNILVAIKRLSLIDSLCPRAAVVHLNFLAGSTFVLYRPDIGLIKQTLNRTSQCNNVDAVRHQVKFNVTKGTEVRVERWQCPVEVVPWNLYLVNYVENVVSRDLIVFISDNSNIFSCSRNAQVTFVENPNGKETCFKIVNIHI